MKLGIATWSIPWSIGVVGYPPPRQPLGALDLLEKAVEANVSVVQIADNLPLHNLSDDELDRLRDAAQARALVLEVGTRGLDADHLSRYVAIAHRIGARILRTVMSGSLCDTSQWIRAEASIREVLPVLERQNVTLAVENNEAFSAQEFAEIIENIRSPHVGICLDTANSLGRPETLQTVIENLAEHAVVLHAKDYDIRRVDTRMGFSVIGRAAGGGRVNFDWVLTELQRHGRTEISVIVEHWPPFVGTIEESITLEQEWLERSVRFLRPKMLPVTTTVVNQ